jgi:hypothetical protein
VKPASVKAHRTAKHKVDTYGGPLPLFYDQIYFCGSTKAALLHLVTISPTFYEQLLRQNPFAKKLETQIVST